MSRYPLIYHLIILHPPMGLNRLDKRNKGHIFARDDTGVIWSKPLNANDNVAFVAANDNTVVEVAVAA